MALTLSHPRIICIGANLESLIVLKVFVKQGITLCGLVTLPETQETKGSDYRNLAPFAKSNNIPLIITENINSADTKRKIRELQPDYVFILGWSQVLDSELISIAKNVVVGSHPSALPFGAGRAPVPWTILDELETSAVTFFEITDEVDAGGIFLQIPFKIEKNITANLLYNIISKYLAEGFLEIYNKIINNSLALERQKRNDRTVRAKRTYNDGLIDFNKSSADVDKLIRAVTDPYPGAFTFYKDEVLTIWNSELPVSCYHKGVPGQILKKDENKLLVQCGDKPIYVYNFSVKGETVDCSYFQLGDKLGLNPIIEVINLRNEIKTLKKVLEENGIYHK